MTLRYHTINIRSLQPSCPSTLLPSLRQPDQFLFLKTLLGVCAMVVDRAQALPPALSQAGSAPWRLLLGWLGTNLPPPQPVYAVAFAQSAQVQLLSLQVSIYNPSLSLCI